MFGLGQNSGNSRYMDPRPQFSQQLMQSGASTAPVQHWSQGLGRMAQMLLGLKMQEQLKGEAGDRQSNMGEAIREMMAEKVGEDMTDTLQLGQQYGGSSVVMKSEDVPSEAVVHRPPGRSSMAQAGDLTALDMPDQDERIGRPIMGLGRLGKSLMAMNQNTLGGIDPALLLGMGMRQDDRNFAQDLAQSNYERTRGDQLTDQKALFDQQEKLKGIVPPRQPRPGVDTPLTTDVFNQKKQLAEAGRPIQVTPGVKAADVAFGKDYAETYLSGGVADAIKNLDQLDDIASQLESIAEGKSNSNLTGPVLGRTPDIIKEFSNPEAIAARDRVEEVVQRNLRVILGAQFTEQEGKGLIARAYNPNLSEKENASRVRRLSDAMRSALAMKQKAAKYFEKNQTMQGFKGSSQFSIGDFESAIDGKRRKSDNPGGWSIKRVD